MTINSAKRLSAASKKLTAGVDKKNAYALFQNYTISDFDEYNQLAKIFIALGYKDLLLEFIIKSFNENNIIQELKDLVSERGLSEVDYNTFARLPDYRQITRDGYRIHNSIANDKWHDKLIIDDVLNYLTKVCC